jgi:hypothetical protein
MCLIGGELRRSPACAPVPVPNRDGPMPISRDGTTPAPKSVANLLLANVTELLNIFLSTAALLCVKSGY